MPRSIVLCNGHLFCGIDDRLRIRDLCFPGVGGPNHLNGRAIRFGIWVQNELLWMDSEAWEINIAMANRGASANAEARHRNGHLKLTFDIGLATESSTLAIGITVHNLLGSHQDLRFFCTEQLCINESDIGDTVLFHAPSGSMLHFKGDIGFGFWGGNSSEGIAAYSCGIKDFGGAEGTYRDAEDGALSGNPIAQGSVDCTFCVNAPVSALGHTSLWFAVMPVENPLGKGGKIPALTSSAISAIHKESQARGTEILERFGPMFDRLPEEVAKFATSSISVLLAHCDPGGAIIAAVDSDIMSTNRAHYRYCWMRDGANVASILLTLGLTEPATKFFEFCEQVLDPEYPAFLQKYTASGCVGATWHPWLSVDSHSRPVQEDESALVVHVLSEALLSGAVDSKFCESLLAPLARFLIEFVDKKSGLPLPSYDLWEESLGTHLNTAATVVAALEFSSLAMKGHDLELAKKAGAKANSIRKSLVKTFWDEERQILARSIDIHGNLDWRVDSSALAAIQLGIVAADGEISDNVISRISNELSVRSSVGGIARYQDDYYFRASFEHPGNPWIITSLWLAQVQIQRAATIGDLDEPIAWLRWAMNLAGDNGLLAEQYHPDTGEPLSVSPLTWSHAEFVKTALQLQQWLVSKKQSLA